MSVEPGIVDANVLVYAMDADAPQHAVSRALLDAARNSSTTLYVTSQILCEFYSVVTNAPHVPNRGLLPTHSVPFLACSLSCMCCQSRPVRWKGVARDFRAGIKSWAEPYSICKSSLPCSPTAPTAFTPSTAATSTVSRTRGCDPIKPLPCRFWLSRKLFPKKLEEWKHQESSP
jgi:hypothetical protein